MYIHTCIYMCIYIYTSAYIYIHTFINMCVYIYIQIARIHIHIYICVCICCRLCIIWGLVGMTVSCVFYKQLGAFTAHFLETTSHFEKMEFEPCRRQGCHL